MSLKKLALIGGVLLAAAIGAVAIVVHQLDAGALAGRLAGKVRASTGRDFQVGGGTISIFPLPRIVLTDVRFANAQWGSQPWLAQAKTVAASIDLKRLLAGNLRIKHIELEDAHILLETNREGVGNWTLPLRASGAPPSLEALEVDGFDIDTLDFVYRNGITNETTATTLTSAHLTAADAPGVIEVTVRAKYNGKDVEAAGTIGTLAGLLANRRNYPIELDGKIGVASISIHGVIEEPHELRGLDLKLGAQIPEFADYIAQLGAAVPPLGPFRGQTQLTGSANAPVFSGIDIELGAAQRMKLALKGALAGRRSGGDYEWQSPGLDFVLQGAQFADLSQWYGRPLPAWGEYKIAGRLDGPSAQPALRAIDASFGGGDRPQIKVRGAMQDLRAGRGIDVQVAAAASDWWRPVLIPSSPLLPPFRASARVRDARGGYRIENLDLKIADSAVVASLNVIPGGPRLKITGKAVSPLIDLSRIAMPKNKSDQPAASAAPSPGADRWKFADVDFELKVGRLVLPDRRQIQSATGRLAVNDGRIKASGLEFAIANSKIKLDGVVAEPQTLGGIDLRVAAQGTDLAELGKFFGHALPAAGPFQVRAHVTGGSEAIGLQEIDATFGKPGQNLRVNGEIADASKWLGIKVAVTANVNDSVAAGKLLGMDLPKLPPANLSARLTRLQDGYALDDAKLTLGRSSMQGRVAYATGETRPHVSATISGPLVDLSQLAEFQPKADAPNPLLAADVDAQLNFNRVTLPDRRSLGPVSGSLRLAAGVVELKQFMVAVDGARATFDGTIEQPLTFSKLALGFTAQLTDANGLAALTGLRVGALPAFTASGKLNDVANGYALSALKITGAAAALSGELGIVKGAKRFRLTAKAASPLLDLSSFFAPSPGTPAQSPPGARAIPDTPLPLDALRAVDGDFDLRFDTLKVGEAPPLGPLLVRAVINDGVLKAEPVQLDAKPGQSLSVSGTVDAPDARWALRIKGNNIDFGDMLARFGRSGIVTGGNTELALTLDATGKSLPALLGSLNGDARITVGPFKIHNFRVPLEGGTIIQMFGLANPFLKADPDTSVKCFAAKVPIKNGVISSERRVATETAKYNAIMSGTMNLRTEQLDLAVTPVVRGEVKTVVHLRGTLAAPVVEVNAVGAIARSAVSVGATVATLGGWWMADTVLNKVASDASPCATALAQ